MVVLKLFYNKTYLLSPRVDSNGVHFIDHFKIPIKFILSNRVNLMANQNKSYNIWEIITNAHAQSEPT